MITAKTAVMWRVVLGTRPRLTNTQRCGLKCEKVRSCCSVVSGPEARGGQAEESSDCCVTTAIPAWSLRSAGQLVWRNVRTGGGG